MPPHAYLWATSKRKLHEFLQHCTLHGAYYLSRPRWWLRILWLLIVFNSLGLCCFLSHMIWDKFVTDPTLTVVETTHYSTANIPFPAVSICDSAVVHRPTTGNITKLLTLRGYSQSQIEDFYDSFTSMTNKDYSPAPYVRKMHYLLDDLGYSWRNLLDMFQTPCEEILLECHWRSRPHNCSEMFRSVYTVVGYCCQFDITYFKQQSTTETNFVAGVHTTEALDIVIKQSKETQKGSAIGGSIVIYVFDSKDRVTLIDSPFLVTSASFFDVNVYLWAIDSSSYVKALDLHSRKCLIESDEEISYSFYQGCLMKIILKKVSKECKCLPFELSANSLGVDDYPPCTWDRLICIHREIDKTKGMVREIISSSECYQRCDYVQYETEAAVARHNREFNISQTAQSRIAVHFSDATCMKYRREVLYTWDQMLANLGGIFGLCLGGSIVSIMEIIWFIIDLLSTIFHEVFIKKKVKSKTNEENQHNIFTIDQISSKNNIKLVKAKTSKSNIKDFNKFVGEAKFKFVN